MHPGFFLHVALPRSTRFFLFLALWAAPFVASAATPVGYFDALDSDGVISGWAVDLDAPSTSIDVHVYMDGPAGGAGKLIGIGKAAFPRPDVNQAIGYPGDYGFKYSLPPITRDGATHTYYVYGIDTSGIGPENRLLIGSPKTAALPSTIVRIDNGTIKVGIEPRCGGTIAEITFNGTNLVNNYDCTGRQIQVAQYDGNSTYAMVLEALCSRKRSQGTVSISKLSRISGSQKTKAEGRADRFFRMSLLNSGCPLCRDRRMPSKCIRK